MSAMTTSYGTIDAETFLTLAADVALRAFGALTLAPTGDKLWVYPDGRHDIKARPTRVYVTFAKAGDYAEREDLRNRLVINARPCAKCAASVAEHSEYFRQRGTGACGNYDAGLQKSSAA
jgi:hypothetical protein